MKSFFKAAFLGLALTAAAATGAMAGKTTTPNISAPLALDAGLVAAINAALAGNLVSGTTVVGGTTDGSRITLTFSGGQVVTVTSQFLSMLLAAYG